MRYIFYLAGLISGDGYIEKKGNRIDLRAKSNRFKQEVASISKEFNPKIDSKHNRIRIISKELVEVLTNKFKIPRGKKSATFPFPEFIWGIKDTQVKEYVAGWFDAEGWLELDKRYKPAYPRIRFCISNLSIRNNLAEILRKLGFKVKTFSFKKRFCLDLNGRKNSELFFKVIPVRHPKWLHYSVMNKSLLLAHTARQANRVRF